MLSMADVSLDLFLPVFATTGVPVAFLVPTPTGYEKSIMDATAPVRQLLKDAGLHDYATQGQGPINKVQVKSYFVSDDELIETKASLYRPQTKQGDPRIWFSDLRKYCSPCNLLAVIVKDECIYVLNLSKPAVAESLHQHGFVYHILVEAKHVALVERYEEADGRLKVLQAERSRRMDIRKNTEWFMEIFSQQEGLLDEFDEGLFFALADVMTIYHDGRVVVRFRDGVEIEPSPISTSKTA